MTAPRANPLCRDQVLHPPHGTGNARRCRSGEIWEMEKGGGERGMRGPDGVGAWGGSQKQRHTCVPVHYRTSIIDISHVGLRPGGVWKPAQPTGGPRSYRLAAAVRFSALSLAPTIRAPPQGSWRQEPGAAECRRRIASCSLRSFGPRPPPPFALRRAVRAQSTVAPLGSYA